MKSVVFATSCQYETFCIETVDPEKVCGVPDLIRAFLLGYLFVSIRVSQELARPM